jgi:hypothetical protein
MMTSLLALIVCTVLALSFASTRGIGILGMGILILLFPIITTAIALILGAAFFVYHHKKGIKP